MIITVGELKDYITLLDLNRDKPVTLTAEQKAEISYCLKDYLSLNLKLSGHWDKTPKEQK